MQARSPEDERNISRAFELAYFIIPDKTIALRILEDAWCSLDVTLGKQARSRKIYDQLVGYVKGEERSRPFRTKVKLSRDQLLQWLIYAQSDSWERATEYGDNLYSPRMEDMLVRYIKHLVRITSNRNSFYVTLGITRLLYEYGTKEIRLMYDVLTASDAALMKDAKYFRKQKTILMDELLARFDEILKVVTTDYREKRFESQPTTERWIRLVRESMSRFVPWETSCVVKDGFDPTAISGLYFSGAHFADEDRIEASRIHTILHPDCFSRFVNGLSKFVEKLPADSPDKNCKFSEPEAALSIPQFQSFRSNDSLDDRFDPPSLQAEDYLRLERSKEMLTRRRQRHDPHRLCVRVDDVEHVRFDPRRRTHVQLEISPSNSIVEVFGEDAEGPLRLATLIVSWDESFQNSIVLEAGQKVTIQVQPIRNVNGNIAKVRVEISYAETKLVRSISLHTQQLWLSVTDRMRNAEGINVIDGESWRRIVVVFALIVAVLAILWFHLRSRREPPLVGGGPTLSPKVQPSGTAIPSVTPTPIQTQTPKLMASASWNQSPEAAREAIRLESERGGITRLEILSRQRSVLIALPQVDLEKQAFSYYRIRLLADSKAIWQQTLRAPRVNLSRHAHVLNVLLPSERQVNQKTLVLRFDGKSKRDWQLLGEVALQRTER